MAIPVPQKSVDNDKIKCILLVDDDPIANYLHLKLINNLNMAERIDIVTNGEEALKYIKEVCQPELLFLDINMPVLNGIEFLKKYNNLQPVPEIRIVVLTASEHQVDILSTSEMGIQYYLNKPLTEDKLKVVLT
ncbi:MAG: response regulator [Bacteroidota bacterium]|nr:response regulator [Bacteroidota bacterium]MDQ3537044.1 response regulator [Bacteroidota bacterium]